MRDIQYLLFLFMHLARAADFNHIIDLVTTFLGNSFSLPIP
jgi:hypothetical protein